jgi:hypothetical protein
MGTLVAAVALFWAVLSYPASLWWGERMFVQSAVAAVLCLAPALVSLALMRPESLRTPDKQLRLVVGGMGLRMVCVLGLGALGYAVVDHLHADAFWIWLLVFYLTTLAVETGLILRALREEALP